MFFIENKLRQIVLFLFRRSNVMYWTSEHDLLLCREVVFKNLLKARKGSSHRSEIWPDRTANTLNSCPKPVFAVNKSSVRDRVSILIRFLVSKETVVLHQWERSIQKFGFIKRVD